MCVGEINGSKALPAPTEELGLPGWSIKYLSPECCVGCHRLKFENLYGGVTRSLIITLGFGSFAGCANSKTYATENTSGYNSL